MGQAAVQRVDAIEHGVVDLPVIGTVRLPAPEHIAYYGAIGLLVALEVIDWPVAVLIAGGHALANRQHGRTIQELAEALEDA
jgi:xanthosine utilization system XapX-like protein